jgi:hypothetical protein
MIGLSTGARVSVSCAVCGATFSYRRIPGPGRLRRTCSEPCRKARAREQAQAREPVVRPLRQRTCVQCGAAFETATGTRTCGQACARTFMMARSAEGRAREAQVRRTRECRQCGRTFVAQRKNGAQARGVMTWGKYCSHDCSAWAARGRRPWQPPTCEKIAP